MRQGIAAGEYQMSTKRLRILVSAYACNPAGSLQLHPGEDLTGWRLVEQLGRFHDLWVISHSYNKPGVESARSTATDGSPRFFFVELPRTLKWLYRVEFGQRIYYYLWQIKAWRVARRLYKEIEFDIAHHVTFGNDWIASYIGAFLPVPFVWGPVGGGQRTPKLLRSEYSIYGRFAEDIRNIAQWFGRRDPVRRRAIKRAKAILVCNRETRDLVPELFRDKTVFFPVNGISRDDILPGPVGARGARVFRILTAGRLHRLKGFVLAIRAFGRFASERPGARMLIIGKGPEEGRLKRLIKEMGLDDSVRIQDWLPRNEVLKAMQSSDVFLFPSFRDGGGAVVVEAMASGLPVICLDSGGPGSHIRAEWGIKVSPSDPDRVALEMGCALRTLHDDEGFRASLGEAARKRAVEYYLWDALGDRLLEIYRSIVPGPPKSGELSGLNLRA